VIKFSLVCEHDHGFEAWFKNSDDFDTQKKRGFLECPVCGSSAVSKGLMAPSISKGGASGGQDVAVAPNADVKREIMAKLQEIGRLVRQNGENVGSKFAEEARKIHYGEADARGIYGKASPEEVKGLVEEGVGVMPLPELPEELN